mmetsp:Transcript_5343/g.7876  ORF Transcript_5343/g.7876 Transcript_5343/m.7876 type:complete len:430 (+) Transcript_5343:227-1516(+)
MGVFCILLPSLAKGLDTSSREAPPLPGTEQLFQISQEFPQESAIEAAWASASLLLNTNANRILLVRNDGEVFLARGFFKNAANYATKPQGSLLNDLSKDFRGYESPKVTKLCKEGGFLQSRAELDLAGISSGLSVADAQTAVIAPIGAWGSLWALSDTTYALSRKKDRNWISNLARKLSHFLSPDFKKGGLSQKQLISTSDETDGLIQQNPGLVRAIPLFSGLLGLGALFANRFLSAEPPTEHVTQADLAAFPLATTLTLTGLIWSDAIKAREPTPVNLEGDSTPVLKVHESVSDNNVGAELKWAWEALDAATRCKSLVILTKNNQTLLQAGLARTDASIKDAASPKTGPIMQRAIATDKGSYIANLQLNSGRGEFSFLPEMTQGVLTKPIGNEAVMILGTDTVRGFTPVDQAWVSSVSEKLSVTLGYR